MKGFVTFYVNLKEGKQLDEEFKSLAAAVRETNKAVFNRIETEIGYQIVIVPCLNEGGRVEKVDFNKPHPRFLGSTVDISKIKERRKETQ